MKTNTDNFKKELIELMEKYDVEIGYECEGEGYSICNEEIVFDYKADGFVKSFAVSGTFIEAKDIKDN